MNECGENSDSQELIVRERVFYSSNIILMSQRSCALDALRCQQRAVCGDARPPVRVRMGEAVRAERVLIGSGEEERR